MRAVSALFSAVHRFDMRRSSVSELLDMPSGGDVSPAELANNLADIARLNALTGNTRVLCQAACMLLPTAAASHTVLDVGTGAADWPPAFAAYLHSRQSVPVQMIAADVNSAVLHYARQRLPAGQLIGADGTQLPLARGSVDIAVCAQTFHHLSPDQAADLLRELARVSRCGFIIYDLARSRPALIAVQTLTHLVSRNRLTRHDGPLSVRRAYRPDEVYAIAASAGLIRPAFTIWPVRPFRWLAIYRR